MSDPAFAPLRFGKMYLFHLVERLIEKNLDEKKRRSLQRYCNGLQQGWCSACSGTDSPAWVQQALQEYFQSACVSYSAPHIMSAEIDPAKRAFIMAACRPLQLFDDMFKVISAEPVMNHVTGEFEVPDSQNRSRTWWIGFSCKTASSLNTRSKELTIVDNHTCSTGYTFYGVTLILQKHRPKTFVLENVVSLLQNGLIEVIEAELRALGYAIHHHVFHTRTFGFPQDRRRVYIFGFRNSVIEDAAVSLSDLSAFIEASIQQLESNHELMNIEDFC